MNLKEVRDAIRNYPGVLRKGPIQEVLGLLGETQGFGPQLKNYGDDAAIIPFADSYLLLACDGMMTNLLVQEPYAAGKAAIMVTVNDIYAMGGRPLGLVNVLASGDKRQRSQIITGLTKGCQKLQVPMLGGHLHPDGPVGQPALSVAILGQADRPIRSHLCQPGDKLLLAMDLRGQAGCKSVLSWDANSGKSSEELRRRLEILPELAQKGLVHAGKDISNGGILGTMAIMLENSGKGGCLDLESIPKPATLSLRDWLLSFQSYGFVLSADPENSERIVEAFAKQEITAGIVGRVTEDPQVVIKNNNEQELLFDFSTEAITGIHFDDKQPDNPSRSSL